MTCQVQNSSQSTTLKNLFLFQVILFLGHFCHLKRRFQRDYTIYSIYNNHDIKNSYHKYCVNSTRDNTAKHLSVSFMFFILHLRETQNKENSRSIWLNAIFIYIQYNRYCDNIAFVYYFARGKWALPKFIFSTLIHTVQYIRHLQWSFRALLTERLLLLCKYNGVLYI